MQEAVLNDGAEDFNKELKKCDVDLVYTKTWRSMEDGAVRPQRKKGKTRAGMPNHVKMNNVTVEVEDLFDLGGGVTTKTPSQSGVAGHDINCRCYLSYELMERAEFEKLAGNSLTNDKDSGIIEVQGGRIMNINNIDSPIEQRNTGKGNPNAILQAGRPLNSRQQELLDKLPEFDSKIVVSKKFVNMKDLSALTAETGDEFAMFTKNGERLVIRGNCRQVNVTIDYAKELNEQGYKWSGHTHPGLTLDFATPSVGDKDILECFLQKTSAIYNSKGQYRTFEKE